jgi:cytochrome b
MDKNIEQVKVWDVPLRLFHWSLVVGFSLAYLLAEFHIMDLHVLLGYFLSALVLFRLFWGFAGSRYARFKSFLFSPQETLTYMKAMRGGQPAHYYGHNPAGALMVFAMLALLVLSSVTGVVTLSVIDFDGPLLFLANRVSDEASYFFRHAHSLLVHAALLLVPLHLLGVLSGSLQHKENLVRAMLTGMKKVVTPNSTQH